MYLLIWREWKGECERGEREVVVEGRSLMNRYLLSKLFFFIYSHQGKGEGP